MCVKDHGRLENLLPERPDRRGESAVSRSSTPQEPSNSVQPLQPKKVGKAFRPEEWRLVGKVENKGRRETVGGELAVDK